VDVLKGKTVLVTGASRGIGFSTARMLAESGTWVGMVARSAAELSQAADAVGGHAISADTSSPADVHRLSTYLQEVLGGAPDIVINAAGSFHLSPFASTEPDDFDRQLDANLRGPFLVIRAFLPEMLDRRDGHIVNLGSVAGRVPLPGNAAYGAAKFGLHGLHEILAEELRGSGVRATLVEPGATNTSIWDPIDPDSRADLPARAEMLQADDIARAIVYAVSQPPGVEVRYLSIRAS
jgi:NADP-dependent 3-hydroxy acid dehydrogenase YdfG